LQVDVPVVERDFHFEIRVARQEFRYTW